MRFSLSLALLAAVAVAAQKSVVISCIKARGPCNNMCYAANQAGQPGTLTRSPEGNHRKESGCTKNPCANTKYKVTGNSCDEYPFATAAEGGTGAILRCVPLLENKSQGGQLSREYRKNGINVGDQYRVGVMNFSQAAFCETASKKNDGTEFKLRNGVFVNAKRDIDGRDFEDVQPAPGTTVPNKNVLYEDSAGFEILMLVGGDEEFDPESLLGEETYNAELDIMTTFVKIL